MSFFITNLVSDLIKILGKLLKSENNNIFRNKYKYNKQIIWINKQEKREKHMISIKIYKRGKDLLVGACDEKLLGKKFEDGKFQIEVKRDFYDGERITSKALIKLLEDATIANLVGKETIKCAIKAGVVDPECIIEIKGIPHAQMVKMLM